MAQQVGVVVLSSAIAGTLSYWGSQSAMQRDVVHLREAVERLDETTVKLEVYAGLKEELKEHKTQDGHPPATIEIARISDKVARHAERLRDIENALRSHQR